MLVECLRLDVDAIPYEYETDINMLLRMFDDTLGDRSSKFANSKQILFKYIEEKILKFVIQRAIVFFLHVEKPGQLALIATRSAFKFNVENSELSHFFVEMANRLATSANSKFDMFVPLGSSGTFHY